MARIRCQTHLFQTNKRYKGKKCYHCSLIILLGDWVLAKRGKRVYCQECFERLGMAKVI